MWLGCLLVLAALSAARTTTPSIPSPTTDTTMSTTPGGLRDTVIAAKNPEQEARELYDRALKQWSGVLQNGEGNANKAHVICAQWTARHCQCSGHREFALQCRSIGLSKVPSDLPSALVKLDLSSNNITHLGPRSFETLSNLEELILSDNRLANINNDAFEGAVKLKRLVLQGCSLLNIPAKAFLPLQALTSLQLDGNSIELAASESFLSLTNLRSLRLDSNKIATIPSEALTVLPNLEALNLGNNRLTLLQDNAFPAMENLVILLLKRNRISTVENGALSNLTALRVLELDDNLLSEVPWTLTALKQLQELSVSGNKVRRLAKGSLPRGLSLLELRGNPLTEIETDAFQQMPRLRKLVLSEARGLQSLPSLEGAGALEVLRVDRASLKEVPESLCRSCPRLKSLELKSNRLANVPELTACRDLRVLDLAGNNIVSIEGRPFKGLGQLHDLLLAHNHITVLKIDAFHGLSRLQVLDLEGNKIEYIHPETFIGISQLEDLNLGNNMFPTLPHIGFRRLLHLKTFNNPKLREIPPPEAFPRIQSLVLSYAYHCCAFLPLVPVGPPPRATLRDSVIFPFPDMEVDMSLWNSSQTDLWPQLHNLTNKFGSEITDLWDNFGSDFTYPGNLPAYVDEYFQEENGKLTPTDNPPGKVQCLPLPGPFLPCQDLFDWWSLRCGVWVVFLLSMLGNGTVVFVLMFSRSKMDVPRFLVCNLAAADFFMGVYLGFLAVVDASTLGEFRMFAIPWQMSIGCQLSGFLAVLSSELSVYTLAVITLERNYAITHAMHLNKRLSLKHAGYIMAVGWAFAISMAILPLFGVSDYRKFAVCLPFETNGPASLAYVVFLMLINGVAFLILMGCYLKMYCAIRGSQAWNSNDSRIAKRMALLVFTDFLCWSPIAFFSLTAAFGLQLISLEEAKIFTVFVLPLNSCCNPFLYAILTKQFKKDCVLICKAIEESRVTRGIGRCRHSSNFSNRQTPANTNSLVERSSREMPALNTHACGCNAKLLLEPEVQANQSQPTGLLTKARRLLCSTRNSDFRRTRSDQYAYQIAEIQQKQHKRAGSLSSDNFSSSRSDSWRQQGAHNCGIPLRLLDPRKRASSWIVTRKASQDSNLSSSRNDSSGSATTASTSTWRVSRSSAGSTTPLPPPLAPLPLESRSKPRLIRQAAVQDDHADILGSPRLAVRFLATIPSAAESSVQLDEDSTEPSGAPFYAVLHGSGAQASLHSKPGSSNSLDKIA